MTFDFIFSEGTELKTALQNGGHKMITIEQVAKQLSDNVSIEFTNELTATYFLHLDNDGNLNPFGGVSFHSDRDISEFAGEEDASRIYETETLDNPDFRSVCKDLANQANEWISENV